MSPVGISKMSEEELHARHDEVAKRTTSVPNDYLEELRFRAQSRISEQIGRYTRTNLWLTAIITLTTITNVAVALWVFFGRADP